MPTEPMSAAEVAALPPVITVRTAARVLGFHEDYLYRLANAGELPGAVRLGSRWRVVTSRFLQGYGIEADDGDKRPNLRVVHGHAEEPR